MHTLQVENITKKFEVTEEERKISGTKDKYKTVVDNVSFEIRAGDVFWLLGPNGAGKTTIMRMLSSLIKPDGGRILYDNVELSKSQIDIRQRFAFLTSELKLDPNSTPDEMFNFFSNLYHVPKEEQKRRKETIFKQFGISQFAGTKISKLSQGMKQKTSLAISVLHDSDFIIFDEPTNGLDVLSAQDVRNFILSMLDAGKCIIVSTHIFSLIEKTCNRVALIVDGHIICDDTLDNVRKGNDLEDAFHEIYLDYLEKEGRK